MPTANELATAALAKSPTLLRNALVKRVIYVIDENEDPEDFTANEAGTVPLAIALQSTRTIFWLDPDDAISDHDGVSVVKTSDGYRYHASDFRWPTSLFAVAQNDPPSDSPGPNPGDAYHIGVAPTAEWSSNPGDIGIWTSRGWVFLTPPEGLLFYNSADGLHYHLDKNGDFVSITIVPGPNTVFHDAIVGGRRFYVVENQDTNTPPTPTVGIWHIVGGSPTGDWNGQSGKLATSKDGSTFVFVTPTEGDHAYDKNLNALHKFDGTTWANAAGAYLQQASAADDDSEAITAGTNTGNGNTGYSYSDTVAPTASAERRGDETLTLDLAASTAGAILEFEYQARVNLAASAGSTNASIGLFRDSETDAIDWQMISSTAVSGAILVNVSFRVAAGDTAQHTYRVRLFHRIESGAVSATTTCTVSRRRMFAREAV
jgi:hypothetical protein